MNSLADKQTERRFNIAFITLFSLLFLLAPSYYQPNQGGEGLFLPFNNVVWIVVSFILGLALLKILHTRHLYVPSMTYVMLFFLGTTTVLGIANSVATPVSWLFRSLALWGGVLFFLAMAQFKLNRRWQDNLLYIIMISAAIQSIYGLIQVIFTDPAPTWLPHSPGIPRGIFQQENLNASYSATGLVIASYLITTPSYKGRSFPNKLLPLLVAVLCSSTLISTDSRTGWLGTGLALLILIFSQCKQLRLFILALAIGAICTATFLPFTTTTNNSNTAQQQSSMKPNNFRDAIYRSSIELIIERPILGHGIGQFQKVWHEKKIEYIKKHPEKAVLQPRLSHPHNELLYWAIEGGAAAVLGILTMAGSFIWCCFRLGWQRGGTYLAITTPIAVHTQVELPFYISQLHWITFIVLIAITANHHTKNKKVKLSSAARTLGLTIALGFPVLSTAFFSDSLSAINSTIQYIINREKDIRALDKPASNIYHTENINLLRMQLLLHIGRSEKNAEILGEYISMAKAHLSHTPDVGVFSGLSIALHHQKQYDLSHQIIAQALAIYPTNPTILRTRKSIMELDKKAGIFDQYWRSVPAPDPQ